MGNKESGFGVVFEFDPAGGTTWQAITAIREINPPDITKTTFDVTTHDSPGGYEELRRNRVKRSDDMEILIAYDPGDPVHEALIAAVENDDDSVVPNCRFTFPTANAQIWTFNALFLAWNVVTPMEDGAIEATLTIHRVGAMARATS